jgi:hypothetical protein
MDDAPGEPELSTCSLPELPEVSDPPAIAMEDVRAVQAARLEPPLDHARELADRG